MAARLCVARVLTLVCVTAWVGGCSSILTEGTSAGAGIAGAAAAHAVTHNAAVTTGIGLGVQAAARAGLEYAERKVHGTEQDRIAAVAGELAPGAVADWRVVHDVPIEANEHGKVTVSRLLGDAHFACKEIVFSVDREHKHATTREFYTADICRDGAQWKWATAEPATERWGALQ